MAKQCSKCGVRPPEDPAYPNRGWRHVWCRPCWQVWARANYLKNRERYAAAQKRYRATSTIPQDAMCPRCGIRPSRAAGQPNRSSQLRLCVECNRAYDTKRYQRAVRHQQAIYARCKAQAKRRGATVFCTFEEWREIASASTCRWCGIDLHPAFRQVDHIIPLSQGGQHTRDNLVASCANCNARRGWEAKVKYPHLYLKE